MSTIKVRTEGHVVRNVRAGGEAFGYLVLFAVFAFPVLLAIKFWYVSVPLVAVLLVCGWFNDRHRKAEAAKARQRAEAEAAAAVTMPIAVPRDVIATSSGRHAR